MSIVLVIAPHPDDETLGCAGTLLKHKSKGDKIHWLIVTSIHVGQHFSEEMRQRRQLEIEKVHQCYGFENVYELGFPTAELDRIPKSELVSAMAAVISELKPVILYIPYRNDVHSDHEITFDAAAACTKSFRYPFIKSVRAYETLSETEFGLRPEDTGFRPNYFVDIKGFLAEKLEIMTVYESEVKSCPHPRSLEVISALATVRVSVIGSSAAEAFVSLRDIA